MGVGQTFGNKRKLEVKIKSEVPKQKNFRAMISEQRKGTTTGTIRIKLSHNC